MVVATSIMEEGKSKKRKGEELQAIQADVASFAASLGLGSSAGVGFDDTDFHKKGSIAGKQKKGEEEEQGKSQKKSSGGSSNWDDKGSKRRAGKKGGGGLNRVVKDLRNGADVAQGIAASDGGAKGSRKRPFHSEQKVESIGKKERKDLSVLDAQDDGDGGGGEDSSQKTKKKKKMGRDDGRNQSNIEDVKEGVVPARSEKNKLLLQSGSVWYQAAETAAANLSSRLAKVSDGKDAAEILKDRSNIGSHEWEETVTKKKKEAEELMEKAVTEYERSRSKNSETRWLMTARRSGTLADKVAAMTVMLQDNPVLNLRTLDALLGLVTSKGGKRQAAIGMDALKEIFLASLLPDRKLKFLAQQPLRLLYNSKEAASLLLYWYWEDCLKHRYERFVVALEEATKDTQPFLREKSLKTVFMLLKSKPEQERRLLSALVNKLGDPERKVASNASYLLSSLLSVHPNMKAVFLNQIVLSNRGDEPVIAAKLINLYFALFQTVTTGEPKEDYDQKTKKGKQPDKRRKESGQSKKKEVQFSIVAEADSRILSALLTGVNRAFPYVAADDVDVIIEEHTPVLFRLVHSSNFNVAVQALMLLHQLMLKNQAVSERFYRALYAILLSPSLTKSSKAEMFLGLLFKALKSDINSDRMSAFAKRLTQVALHQPPQFACGCLLLLSEILKTRPSLWNGILQPEDQDEETEHFVDIPEDTDEVNPSQPIPDGQIVGPNGTEDGIIADGELGEESKSDSDIGDKEKLGGSIPDLGEDNSDSSDEEDSKRSNQEAAMGKESELLMPDTSNKLTTGKKEKIIEAQFSAGAAISGDRNEQLSRKRVWPLEGCYDPRHREPSYCHAERACWWELSALAIHMHPSVASMARTLLSGANIVYSGDPLRDLVLGAFLDRFAEKKPKARKQSEDGTFQGSALPLPIKMVTNARLVGAELLALDESEVAPDDVVFHKFYQTKSMKSRSKSSKKKKTSKDDEDDITGMGDEDGQLVDGDDSDDEEVDALLEKDEGLAMGLKGDDALDDEDTEDFDYDKLGEAFELEDEDESDGELEKVNTDNIAEPDASGSSANEWSQSDNDLDLEEPAESESDVDSQDSIEIGDLPSDTDEEGVAVKAETGKGSTRTKKNKIVTKASKRKPGRKGEPELGGRQKTKLKSPFASVQEYAHLLEDADASEKVSKAKRKRVRQK
ncbi:hypothetical protein CY35_15G097300 [Sphagnum magellanicum]|nr:hypothetical protein CY35_15G097300 [Sphagnum magellanicum]